MTGAADSTISFKAFTALTAALKRAGYTKLYLTRVDRPWGLAFTACPAPQGCIGGGIFGKAGSVSSMTCQGGAEET